MFWVGPVKLRLVVSSLLHIAKAMAGTYMCVKGDFTLLMYNITCVS